jgi:beta-lactam-binding protein with PASTA domain
LDGLGITGTIIRRIAVVVILGATFALSAMFTVYALFHSGQVEVPNVVGMSQDDAKRAVERAGLSFKPRRIHFDTEIPAGVVTDQDPVADFPVKTGYEIKVDISKGVDPTGASEQPELPGPTNPSERPANENANRKPRNKNANANGNGNTNAGAVNGNSAKPKPANANSDKDDNKPKPSKDKDDDKPKPDKDDDKPKPKPPKPKPPPPTR